MAEARLEDDERRTGGQLHAASSHGLVRILAEYTGRGPTRARTILNGDWVFVTLQDASSRYAAVPARHPGTCAPQLRSRLVQRVRNQFARDARRRPLFGPGTPRRTFAPNLPPPGGGMAGRLMHLAIPLPGPRARLPSRAWRRSAAIGRVNGLAAALACAGDRSRVDQRARRLRRLVAATTRRPARSLTAITQLGLSPDARCPEQRPRGSEGRRATATRRPCAGSRRYGPAGPVPPTRTDDVLRRDARSARA